MARGDVVSGTVLWALVSVGLAVVVIRRRSAAVALVTGQALLLAAVALEEAGTGADVAAALALLLRATALGALFLFLVSRTREARPVRAGVAPLARAGLAVALALAPPWLVPEIGLDSRNAERAVLALVAFGLVCAATRRATLFQVLGIVLVENGLALAALELPGATPSLAIELGVAFDLTLIALVAAVFHERIFAEFGAGDTAALRRLRD
jgi:hydrogenase-4 component E